MSVLEGDIETRSELQASVQSINDRLSNSDSDCLEATAERLTSRRARRASELEYRCADLLKARFDENREIVIAGDGHSPVAAARVVANGVGRNDWIPAGVLPGAPMPLCLDELVELYRTARAVSADDELEAVLWLPDPATLPSPDEFAAIIKERSSLAGAEVTTGSQFWDAKHRVADAPRLEDLCNRIEPVLARIDDGEPWKLAVIDAGRLGVPNREPWEELIKLIERTADVTADTAGHVARHAPELPPMPPLPRQKEIALEIVRHLRQGRTLGRLDLLFRPAWKTWIANAKVNGQSPISGEHFRALVALADRTLANRLLADRWDRQLASLGAPGSDQFGTDNLAMGAKQFIPSVRDCLNWHAYHWSPIEAELKALGFRWQDFMAELRPNLAVHGELLRLRDAARDRLPAVLTARAHLARRQKLDADLGSLIDALTSDGCNRPAEAAQNLKAAVGAADHVAYRGHYLRLLKLHELRGDLDLRNKLLSKLTGGAPGWATAIRDRHPPHDTGSVPGDAKAAWLWRQLDEELERRRQSSLPAMEGEIEILKKDLQLLTTELIEHRAWSAQVRRVTPRNVKRL